MKVPNEPGRKKALVVVDVQPGFLNDANRYVVQHIKKLIQSVPYDAYVAAVFYTEKGSLWDKQQQWVLPKGDDTRLEDGIANLLRGRNVIFVEKQTKSAFHGNLPLAEMLRQQGIEEVHVVGVDTNDCVIATAFDAFDSGFITYAIEEGCQSSGSQQLHAAGLEVLRQQCMTNNSCIEPVQYSQISL
jgi:nicotinamidase-related amidase